MRCTHCGSNLSAEDLHNASCTYCGTVLPHHAKAAEKAALVQQLLADANGNGSPDVLEGDLGSAGASSGGSFVSVESASGGLAASVKVTTSVSSRVIVDGVVQPDGAIPEHVAKALASAGVSVPGIGPSAAATKHKSAPWIAIAVAVLVGAILAGLIVAALS